MITLTSYDLNLTAYMASNGYNYQSIDGNLWRNLRQLTDKHHLYIIMSPNMLILIIN